MAHASGACHVAEITRTHGGRRYRYYLLRRTYRQDGKVKHETLGNLSRLPAATIELIRRAVRGDALAAPEESSLGESLGVADADEDALYEAMDWLLARQGRVEQALARRHLADGGLILYDVTSTYFEGRKCPLAKFGHARDGKRDKLQIVFGLLTNGEGCPIAVEEFAGNTGDPTTLPTQIKKIPEPFWITR